MSKFNDTVVLYKQLKSEWSNSKPNLSKCQQLLNELKVNQRDFIYALQQELAGELNQLDILAHDELARL